MIQEAAVIIGKADRFGCALLTDNQSHLLPQKQGTLGAEDLEDVRSVRNCVGDSNDAVATGFELEKWYRGDWKGEKLTLYGQPSQISNRLGGRGLTGRLGRREIDEPLGRMIVFLEALDGRLYFTGMRRRGMKFGAHASVRPILKDGSMVAFSSPEPCARTASKD